MDGVEVAALVVTVAAAVLVGALVVVLAQLQRTARTLEDVVGRLERETLPLVAGLRDAVARTGDDVVRVEALLEGAEAVGRSLDGASRAALRVVSGPVAKVAGLGVGVSRAGRRLREGPPPDPAPGRRRRWP